MPPNYFVLSVAHTSTRVLPVTRQPTAHDSARRRRGSATLRDSRRLLSAVGTAVLTMLSAGVAAAQVSVTPKTATATTINPGTYTQQFSVRNAGTSTAQVSIGPACSGVIASCSSSVPATNSIAAGASLPVSVTYTAPTSGGSGRAALRASLMTSPFTSDTGYVQLTVTATQNYLTADLGFSNNENQDMSLCEASCFAATYASSTVPYFSLDQARSVTLVYHGDRLAVRPFTYVDASILPSAPLTLSRYELRATLNGSAVTFTNGEQVLRFAPPAAGQSQTVRLGAQLDATNLVTGMYPLTDTVTAVYTSGATQKQVLSTKLMVVNEQKSPVARGWTVAGVQRAYVQSDSSLLVTDGTGSAAYFQRSCSTPCTFASPAGDYSTLTPMISSGGTRLYRRAYPDSTAVWFGSAGYADSVVDRFGTKVTFSYDGAGRLTRIADPIRLDYTNQYMCVANTNPPTWCPYPSATVLTYGTYGLASIAEPGANGAAGAGRATTYVVNPDSTLASVTDPDTGATHFGYDGSRRLTTVTDRRGSVFQYAYEPVTWKLTSVTLPAVPIDQGGGTTAPQSPVVLYSAWQSVSVPTGATSTTPAPSTPLANFVGRVTDPKGHATTFTVDRWGEPLQISDALSRVTTITRTGILPTQVSYPTGAVDTYQYSGPFLVTAQPAGRAATYFRYGAYAQLDSVWGPGQPFEMFKYGAGGRLDTAKTRYSSGSTTYYTWSFAHDSYGRLTAYTDPAGHQTTFRYDSTFGNLNFSGEPGGRYDRTVLDRYGRDSLHFTSGRTAADTITYDLANRVTRVRNGASGSPYLFQYDRLFLVKAIDPLGQQFRRDVNALGWVTSEYDPADTTTWSRYISYRYDLDGSATSWTNRRNQRVDLQFDALHRLTSRTANGTTDSYTYSSSNYPPVNTMTASNGVSVDSMFVSQSLWLDSTVTRIGGQRFRRYYRPDTVQRLDSMSVAMLNGPIVFAGRKYLYDAQTNQLTTLRVNGTLGASLTRNSEMFVSAINYLTDSTPWRIRALQYTTNHEVYRDSIGKPGALVDVNLGALFRGYGYDSLSRVSEIVMTPYRSERAFDYTLPGELQKHTDFRIGWPTCDTPPSLNDYGWNCRSLVTSSTDYTALANAYDGAGNRQSTTSTSQQSGVLTTTGTGYYTYVTGNRVQLMRDQGKSYDFERDLDGNITRRSGPSTDTRFSWDAIGRLTGDSVAAGGMTVKYDYNAFGQLVRRTKNGVVDRYFLWDGDDLLAELDGTATSRIAEYVYWGSDSPLAIVTGATTIGTVDYVAQDELGNVMGAFHNANPSDPQTDASLDLNASYSDWGLPTVTGTLASSNRLLWKGLLWEGDSTQLYYVRNRWYDPQAGRFMSEDPIGLVGGMNEYTFAGNDPVNGADGDGLSPWVCDDCTTMSIGEFFYNVGKAVGEAAYKLIRSHKHKHRGAVNEGPSGTGPVLGPVLGAGCPAISDGCDAGPLVPHSTREAVVKGGIIIGAAGIGVGAAFGLEAVLGTGAEAAAAGDLVGPLVSEAERDAANVVARGNAPLLREFFTTGRVPQGLTREVLEAYRTSARYAVQHAAEMDKSGEQLRRLRMIADVLRRM